MNTVKVKLKTKFKDVGTFGEGFALVLLIVFIFLTLTFIYNETEAPIYRATSIIKIDFENTQASKKYQNENIYLYQARLRRLISQMQAPETLGVLSKETELAKILSLEKAPLPKFALWAKVFSSIKAMLRQPASAVSPSSPINRIRSSLNININQDDLTIAVESLDRNPAVAFFVARRLPKMFVGIKNTIDPKLREELLKMDNDIFQSIESFNVPGVVDPVSAPVTPIEPPVVRHQASYEGLTNPYEIRKTIVSLKNLLTGYGTIPEPLKGTRLDETHVYLIQKQIELQAVKTHSRNPAALTREIGFAKAEYVSLVKKTISELNDKLTQLKDTSGTALSPPATLEPADDATMTAAATTTDSQDQLFQKILSQKTLDPFFTNEIVTIKQEASFPIYPASPNKLFNLIVALIAGLTLGSSTAYGIKWWRLIKESKAQPMGLGLKA